jgi:hypothetical protein
VKVFTVAYISAKGETALFNHSFRSLNSAVYAVETNAITVFENLYDPNTMVTSSAFPGLVWDDLMLHAETSLDDGVSPVGEYFITETTLEN